MLLPRTRQVVTRHFDGRIHVYDLARAGFGELAPTAVFRPRAGDEVVSSAVRPDLRGAVYTTLNREAKRTEKRAWLGEVSAVVLQQSLRDLDTAYKNFLDSLKGKRSRMGAPRFKSRTENRQALRFTTNARWSITTGGDLRLPKVGDVRVKWSRNLPSTPSTVTVIKDAAGRYFASFVVETAPEALPATEAVVGIDLGLTHFAILSDGTKIDSPRFLRRAEKKLKKAQ